jgi:hypothetical protein
VTTRPVPLHRLDIAPAEAGPYPTFGQRCTTIRGSLRGVDMGAYDDRVVSWMAGWDDSTVRTLCSWIERARVAERAAVADELEAKIAVLRAEYEAARPVEREPLAEQENYRAGIWLAVHVLRGITEYAIADNPPTDPDERV